jgi:hypothetical protein
MKVWPVQAAALTAVIFASFAEANNLSALNTLANQLKKARSLPAGVDNAFPVPAAHGSIRWHAEYEHLKCTW